MVNTRAPSDEGPVSHDAEESLRKMMRLVNQVISRADSIPFRQPVNWLELGLYDYPKIITKMMDLGTVKRKIERGKYYTVEECADDIRLVWSNCLTYNDGGSDFYLLAEASSRRFEDRFRKLFASGGETSNAASASASSRHQQVKSLSETAKVHSNSLTPPPGSTPVQSQASGNLDKTSSGAHSRTDSDVNPLDVRTRFAARLQRLSGMELGHILQILEFRCPEALEDPSDPSPRQDAAAPVRRNRFYSWEEYDRGSEVEINVDSIPHALFYELDKYVKDKVQGRGRGPWNDEIFSDMNRPTENGAGGAGSGKGKKRKHKSL